MIEENWGGLNTPKSIISTPKNRRSLVSILNPQKVFGRTNKTVGHLLRVVKTKAKRVNFTNTWL